MIGTRQRLPTLPPIESRTIAGTPIPFSDTIKTLGVTLDQNLTLNKHVSVLSRNIHVYTRALHHIRPKILSVVWFCLHFAIFQQVSDSVTSTGFLFTTEY